MAQLEIKSVAKKFGDSRPILESISFDVAKGEFLVILGPSGCGKTTLLRIIAGLETADSGEIILDNKNVTSFEPKDRDIAMVFQNYALYPHMTVFENLAFALRIRKLPQSEIRTRVETTANLIGLSEYLNRKPKQLSGGQRQRVALGRAIIRQPSLYLFDEPLSNLDAELRMKMRSELLSLHRRVSGTSLYVTHDQVEALSLADRIVILNGGKQIGPEKPRVLYDTPPDIFVAGFFGNPGMNFINGTVDNSGQNLLVDSALALVLPTRLPPNSEIVYGFRPEHCQISDKGIIPAKITGYEDSGKEYIVELAGEAAGKLLCLSKASPSVGESVKLDIHRASLFDKTTGKAVFHS
jgi:multiple sugar transport system ATP-binding protein